MLVRVATLIAAAGATVTLLAAPVTLAVPGNATPNADPLEEEGVCELLANSGGDYNFGFRMAVISVQGDTGMSQRDSIRFVYKAIQVSLARVMGPPDCQGDGTTVARY
ncbi:MAG: hypothetical protein ACRDT5_03390 [Mycobacterium sp.]